MGIRRRTGHSHASSLTIGRRAGVRIPVAAASMAMVVLVAGALTGYSVFERTRATSHELATGYLMPLALMAESRGVLGETDSYMLRALTNPQARPPIAALETRAAEAADRIGDLSDQIMGTLPQGAADAFKEYVLAWGQYRNSLNRAMSYARDGHIELATAEYFRAGAPLYARLERHMETAIEQVRAGAADRLGEFGGTVGIGQAVLLGLLTFSAVALLVAAFMTRRFIRNNQIQHQLLDEVHSGIFMTDGNDRVKYWSRGAERMYGWTAEEADGRPIRQLIADSPELSEQIRATVLGEGDRWEGVVRDRRKDGARIYAEIRTSPLYAGGTAQGALTVALDVSEREIATQELRHMALHDSLTGLGNRALLRQRLTSAIAEASADESVALLYVDLVEFKAINDGFGHAAGDQVLRHVGRSLAASVRRGDTVARLGGDEFAIVLRCTDSRAEAAAAAQRLAQALASGAAVATHGIDRQLEIRANVGVAIYPDDAGDPESLVRAADLAMYEAKRQGLALGFYDAERGDQSRLRWRRAQELRTAIKESQLTLHYQPQVRLRDGRVTGVEALVRWNHPADGLLAPMEFVPLAEETGAVDALSRWVVKRALADITALRSDEPELRVAVNLSAANLADPRFMRWLSDRARRLPDASMLRIELTETVVTHASPDMLRSLRRLRHMGVGVSLDDFGTGYSSLSLLRDLPLSEVKIDRSFIGALRSSDRDQRIVRSIIDLTSGLGLEVVAEGVEDALTAVRLREFGCDTVQGYEFGRPVPVEELALAERPAVPLPKIVRTA